MSRAIINMETGEITHINERDRIRIIRESTIDYLKNSEKHKISNEMRIEELGYEKFLPTDQFVKLFSNELFAISEEISKGAFHLFMRLCKYTSMGSNILMTLNNKKKIDFKYIVDNISTTGERQTKSFMKELEEKILLVKCTDIGENTQYVVNPYIYFRGALINKTIRGLFSNYERRSINV